MASLCMPRNNCSCFLRRTSISVHGRTGHYISLGLRSLGEFPRVLQFHVRKMTHTRDDTCLFLRWTLGRPFLQQQEGTSSKLYVGWITADLLAGVDATKEEAEGSVVGRIASSYCFSRRPAFISRQRLIFQSTSFRWVKFFPRQRGSKCNTK